jgi:hypothetical protein
MAVFEVRFKLEKQTKGALRYQEVDPKGEVIEQAWAKIGTLYLRKSAFERGTAWSGFWDRGAQNRGKERHLVDARRQLSDELFQTVIQ